MPVIITILHKASPRSRPAQAQRQKGSNPSEGRRRNLPRQPPSILNTEASPAPKPCPQKESATTAEQRRQQPEQKRRGILPKLHPEPRRNLPRDDNPARHTSREATQNAPQGTADPKPIQGQRPQKQPSAREGEQPEPIPAREPAEKITASGGGSQGGRVVPAEITRTKCRRSTAATVPAAIPAEAIRTAPAEGEDDERHRRTRSAADTKLSRQEQHRAPRRSPQAEGKAAEPAAARSHEKPAAVPAEPQHPSSERDHRRQAQPRSRTTCREPPRAAIPAEHPKPQHHASSSRSPREPREARTPADSPETGTSRRATATRSAPREIYQRQKRPSHPPRNF